MTITGHLGISCHRRVRRRRSLGLWWLALVTVAVAVAGLPVARDNLELLVRELVRG